MSEKDGLKPLCRKRSTASGSFVEDVNSEMAKLFDSTLKVENIVSVHAVEDTMSPKRSSFDLVDSINRHPLEQYEFDDHHRSSYPTMHPIHPIKSSKSLRGKHAKVLEEPQTSGPQPKHVETVVEMEPVSTSVVDGQKAGFYIGSCPSSMSTMEHMDHGHPYSFMTSPAAHTEIYRRHIELIPEKSTEDKLSDLPLPVVTAKPMISVPSRARIESMNQVPEVTIVAPTVPDPHDSSTKHKDRHKKEHFKIWRVPGHEVPTPASMKDFTLASDEADTLKAVDIESIASHRLDEVRGFRRHKRKWGSRKKVNQSDNLPQSVQGSPQSSPMLSRPFPSNNNAHQAFVQLDELRLSVDNRMEWKEQARWIKFEEDVEEEAERWGRPHVASLSFHSLLELRKGIEQGSVLLNVVVRDLPSLMDLVVNNLIHRDQISSEEREQVLSVLLLKHKHGNRRSVHRNLSYHNLQNLLGKHRHSEKQVMDPNKLSTATCDAASSTHPDIVEATGLLLDPLSSADSAARHEVDGDLISSKSLSHKVSIASKEAEEQHDSDILKRIPKDSEATAVLVGAVPFLQTPAVAFVRLSEATKLINLTEVGLPVRFVFILLGPEGNTIDYHEIGRSISTLMSTERFLTAAIDASTRYDLLCAINTFLDESVVLPPGDWDRKTLLPILDMARKKTSVMKKLKKERQDAKKSMDEKSSYRRSVVDLYRDPLRRTGKCFGGLKRDITDRYALYWSDIRDAFNLQCFAAFVFIYFGALSPAITFGGLMSEKTDKLIGVPEHILSSAVCGLLFSVFSTQPLIIVGATGPIVVFEESIYKFCKDNNWEFLPLRFWIGLWCGIIVTLVVAFEGSFLISYVTRFTEEIFSILISVIFIYQTISKLHDIYVVHPLMSSYTESGCGIEEGNSTNTSTNSSSVLDADPTCEPDPSQPNTALLSTILTVGTFLIANYLKGFRYSDFFGKTVRRTIGDFAIPIAMTLMCLLDYLVQDTYTEKLTVPEGKVTPTDPSQRGWFINPLGITKPLPVWQIFAAAIPAMLIFILIFMETEITETIINKKERKLKKGSGFHADIMLCGWLTVLCGVLGLPIVCAAPVRSILHTSALTVYSSNHAPGDSPVLLKVHEQRLTNFFVSLMVGLSVFFGPLLKEIPLACLFGIFLYMGVASLKGVQMFDRLLLFFKPVKHHPNAGFVDRVRTYRMHMFTAIQIVCLAVLWVVKSTAASLAFPFVLILLVPLRKYVLPMIFTEVELEELDQKDIAPEEDESDDENLDYYKKRDSC